MRLHKAASRLSVAATALLTGIAVANGADCSRRDALGTSRVLAVDAKTYPRVGLKSFPQTLPLAVHEVVLTFDDGPRPPNTQKVLAALAQECVRATFFLVGRSSAEFPDLVRRIAAEGHTVAHHSWSHPMMSQMSFEQAMEDIDRGIAADEMALNGAPSKTPSTPVFRFPYFDSTPATLDLLQSRGILVLGADLWAEDWENMTPGAGIEEGDRATRDHQKGNHSAARSAGVDGSYDARVPALPARPRLSDRTLGTECCPSPDARRRSTLMARDRI